MELNKIHNMDCLEGMKQLENDSIDLVVTSPPYNLRNTVGGGFTAQKGTWNNPDGLYKGYESYDDKMPYDEYVRWQRECLNEMMRVISERGAIFYNHKWRVQNGLLQDRSEIVSGFPIRQIVIWWRKNGMNFNDGYFLPTYEVVYLIAKKDFKLKPKGNRIRDVWVFPPDVKTGHPASFPEQLPRNCIESTNAEIILDPFMGIGTTAVVCKKIGRDFIGFEINSNYVDIANKRLEEVPRRLDSFA